MNNIPALKTGGSQGAYNEAQVSAFDLKRVLRKDSRKICAAMKIAKK